MRRNDVTNGRRLDRSITLITPSIDRTNRRAKEDWSSPAASIDVKAMVEYRTTKQKEVVEAARETAFQQVHFVIRYRTGVEKYQRVLFESNYYDIEAIHFEGRKQYIRLITMWKDSDG